MNPQFRLFQSNNLLTLAETFAQSINGYRKNPLRREGIIVQTAGMETWLTQQCARFNGVFAGFEYTRPAKFLLKLNALITGSSELRTVFEPENMRWFIFREIESNPSKYPLVEEYLGGGENGLRRQKLFSFASQTAELFDSYMLYRPDILGSWELGKPATTPMGEPKFTGQTANHESWQMILWQAITAYHNSIPEKDRGENPVAVLNNLARELESDTPSEKLEKWKKSAHAVNLFGMSILPARYMELFKLLSKHCDVNLYVLNPSQFYWGDTLTDRQITYQKKRLTRYDESHEYFNLGNRLLRNLGEAGRDFFHTLYESVSSVAVHEIEAFEESESDSILGEIQRDILSWNDMDREEPIEFENDHSITLNRCYTGHRELESLYDWLLSCFDEDESITLGDVLIITPDIETYAPLITMQFSHRSKLRGTIADQSALAKETELQFVAELLKLPDTRFTASELISLFIRYQRIIGEELTVRDEDKIRKWVTESGIRWGTDGDFWRNRSGASFGDDRFSWRSGLDRMVSGYAGGEIDSDIPTYAEIEGSDGNLLGKLAAFERTVAQLADFSRTSMPVQKWCDLLASWFRKLFLYNEGEHEDAAAAKGTVLPKLIKTIENLKMQVDVIDRDGVPIAVGFSTIRSALKDLLSEDESGSGFLRGSISFASMLPLRSVPFKIIGCIGMNYDLFPRRGNTLSFDLIRASHQRGDRDTRHNDLYLFLEMIVSAKEKLYISWTGFDAQSGEERPASSAVDQLISYLDLNFRIDGKPAGSHLVTNHPLHPFSNRYRIGDPRLFTYQKRWFPEIAPQELFGESIFARSFSVEIESITTRSLLNWLVDPLKDLFENLIGMEFVSVEKSAEDDEPFGANKLVEFQLRESGIRESLGETGAVDATIKSLYFRGDLPAGAALESTKMSSRTEIDRLVARIPESAISIEPTTIKYETVRGGLKIDLETSSVYQAGSEWIAVDAGDMKYGQPTFKFKRWMKLYLNHLIICAIEPAVVKLITRDGTFWYPPIEQAMAEAILGSILDLYAASRTRFVPWFGNCSRIFHENGESVKSVLESSIEESKYKTPDFFESLFMEKSSEDFTPEIEEEAIRVAGIILSGSDGFSKGK